METWEIKDLQTDIETIECAREVLDGLEKTYKFSEGQSNSVKLASTIMEAELNRLYSIQDMNRKDGMTKDDALDIYEEFDPETFLPEQFEAITMAFQALKKDPEIEDCSNLEYLSNHGIDPYELYVKHEGYGDNEKLIIKCKKAHIDTAVNVTRGEVLTAFKLWLGSSYKREVLTDEEREYLESVINPFKKDLIGIELNVGNICLLSDASDWNIPASFQFKGMDEGKKYTLEELGL